MVWHIRAGKQKFYSKYGHRDEKEAVRQTSVSCVNFRLNRNKWSILSMLLGAHLLLASETISGPSKGRADVTLGEAVDIVVCRGDILKDS